MQHFFGTEEVLSRNGNFVMKMSKGQLYISKEFKFISITPALRYRPQCIAENIFSYHLAKTSILSNQTYGFQNSNLIIDIQICLFKIQ